MRNVPEDSPVGYHPFIPFYISLSVGYLSLQRRGLNVTLILLRFYVSGFLCF